VLCLPLDDFGNDVETLEKSVNGRKVRVRALREEWLTEGELFEARP
jgi:hypothetical protein